MDVILSEPEVLLYLSDFPKGEWESVLLQSLLYGIYSLQALSPPPKTAQEIQTKVEEIKFLVLPRMLEAAEAIHEVVKGARASRAETPPDRFTHRPRSGRRT